MTAADSDERLKTKKKSLNSTFSDYNAIVWKKITTLPRKNNDDNMTFRWQNDDVIKEDDGGGQEKQWVEKEEVKWEEEEEARTSYFKRTLLRLTSPFVMVRPKPMGFTSAIGVVSCGKAQIPLSSHFLV